MVATALLSPVASLPTRTNPCDGRALGYPLAKSRSGRSSLDRRATLTYQRPSLYHENGIHGIRRQLVAVAANDNACCSALSIFE